MRRGTMRTFINTCGVVFILVVLLSFSMLNTHPVAIHYYYELTGSFPAWALVILPFFVGVLFGNALDIIQRFKLKSELRKLKQEFRSMRTQ
jgi:uncharacterized integral membrane protein